MRDLLVFALVFSALPFVFKRPWIGILLWFWLAYMNPHRLAYGAAVDFPFAQVVAIVTMIGFLLSKEPKRIPWTIESKILLFFIAWMFASTLLAEYSALAWAQWDKVWKIQLVTFLTLAMMGTRERIHLMMWVIALSLGFYGIKGGIWVLATGGAHRVMGPAATFIGGNNEIGLAMIMTVPVMRYLQLTTQQRWLRWGLGAAMVLTCISILGTHSRGALVGLAAMIFFFLLKTRRRFLPIVFVVALIPAAPYVLPEHWFERMETIETYDEDMSAQNRLKAWREALEIAREHPVFGAGFQVFIGRKTTDAHSVYFELLAEQGFVGFAIFFVLGAVTWASGGWIIRHTKRNPEQEWATHVASMLQVTIVGYASAGTFLGLAYFDLLYHVVALMALTKVVVLRAEKQATAPGASALPTRPGDPRLPPLDPQRVPAGPPPNLSLPDPRRTTRT